GVKRFSELQRAVTGVSQKMLTQQLREMERDGLLHRQVYAEIPPRVEYSLTPLRQSLEPVITSMCEWGGKYRDGQFVEIGGPDGPPGLRDLPSNVTRTSP